MSGEASRAQAARAKLFAAPLDDFVNLRDTLARELRAQGNQQEAAALARLRKPPVALWIANQLARLLPAEVQALIDATARLRHGQSARGATAGELQEAMRDQRDALAKLADAAGRAAAQAGTKLTLDLQRRVQNTVQAAAASEPEALRAGALESELAPAGFEDLLGAAAAPPAAVAGARRKPSEADEKVAAAEKKAQEAAQKKLEAQRARALHEAQAEAKRLDARAARLETRAGELEAAAAEAKREAQAARREAEAAAARASELRRP